MTLEPTILPINPDTFEYQTYSNSDEQLIVQSELDTVFSASTDYIEYYVYDQNKTLIYPLTTTPLLAYDVREGDVLLSPSSNLESLGFDVGIYNISYSFYRKRASSSITEKYFIASISSDRTEIRLDSNTIENSNIISSINDFIQYREAATYFVDFYLNFGNNKLTIANNIKLETEEGIDPTVLIKLYEPLPLDFNVKTELWVVELLSSPQAYQVDFPFEPFIEDDFTYIAGPNYNLNVIGETASPGEQFSYNTLINSDVTSSINQIQSLLSEKEIDININYENFSNFVNFSSAKTRLENFYYKVDLIQSASSQLSTFLNQIATDTVLTPSYSSSAASLTGTIDTIIKNFDGYEYFLYFNSGSTTSYPKSNTEPPFVLYPTGSSVVQNWLTSSAATASNYDDNNRDWLYNSIPEYLRDDPANRNYELFVDMVGQYYDNVWVYTKDVTNKFDADNRLDYGISKDLVSDAIQDFAVKLYSNNFNTDDLFTAFLGLTPSGSAFPFPYMTGSIGGAVATPTGYEYVDTKISASNDIVPLDDVNKRVYKRIYHNIPYLLKTKGTVAGIRALVTSYGIPDTILRISEFGGKDRNESQDYDLKQDVFNYAFDTGVNATNMLRSEIDSNPIFPDGDNSPKSVQLRFKSAPIPVTSNNVASSNIRYSQSIFSTDDGSYLLLEYTGSGFVTGSYSGSIASPYDNYGTLKFIPAASDNPSLSASVYLPFFNEDWWSIQINVSNSNTASLYAANEIDGKIGFNVSSSTTGYDVSEWADAQTAYLNFDINQTPSGMGVYQPFSGSFQELRYWAQTPSQSNFYDYTVNPFSAEGNGVNGTPDQLYFRAALGTQLDTGSRTSIHPRVTGSAVQITSSFDADSSFTLIGENWVTNVEDIFQDQAPVGIKNRITDKIQLEKVILAEAPYGFPNPSASVPEISSVGNYTQTISPMESMQQTSFTSQSITPNIDYLEVAFSPSNQINDDINAQLGYFNLGEYIGDPRFFSSSLRSYPDLDRLRDQYFEKYMSGYDVVDFVRLIKFFDNSLFKMIKDFTPARTSLASGVVVKQHLLERNRQRTAQVTSSLHDYEGLVVNLPKNYSSGSTDFPQYSTSGSAIYKFSGGTGGSFERFNGLQTFSPIPRYGSLLINTSLMSAITSNGVNYGVAGTYNNVIIDVPNAGNSPFPLNADLAVNITTQESVVPGVYELASLEVASTNTAPWSAGNIITILGSEFSQGGGSITIELTSDLINLTSPVTDPYNRFGVTQSWQDGNDGSILNTTNFNQSSSQFISGSYLGPRTWVKNNQSEFYDGIFSGSMIIVATQSLNPGCDPYLNANDTPVIYKPLFFGTSAGLDNVITPGEFANNLNSPPSGYAWISSTQTDQGASGVQQVKSIKLSQNDYNGVEVINYLDDFASLRVIFPDAIVPFGETATEYVITGRTIFSDHAILQVSQTQGNNFYQQVNEGASLVNYFPITSSDNGGSMNWSLSASTDYQIGTVNTESSDLIMQGVFQNPNVSYQEQNYFYWNGSIGDALGFFDTGSLYYNTSTLLTNPLYTQLGAYTIPYTPNVSWHVIADVKYTTDLNSNAGGTTTNEAIYHSGSSYQNANLTNQNFVLGPSVSVGAMYTTEVGYSTATAAASSADVDATDPLVYYDGGLFSNPENIYPNSSLGASGGISDLVINKYYKFSNLTTDGTQYFFVVYVTPSSTFAAQTATLQTGNRYPTGFSKAALQSVTGITTSTTFQPAPLNVSGLGTVLFNDGNYNTQIPGGSGSGVPVTDLGGHPKFKVASTSSILWDFTSLELAGTLPTLSGGSDLFSPFSGSSLLAGNANFTAQFDYNSDFLSQPFEFSTATGEGVSYGGEIVIDVDTLVLGPINETFQTPNYIYGFTFLIDFTAAGMTTGDDMSVTFEYYDEGEGEWALTNNAAITTTGTSSPVCTATNLPVAFTWNNGNANGSAPASWDDIKFRAIVKNNRSDGADFDYVISAFTADMQFDYQWYDDGGGGSFHWLQDTYPSTSTYGGAWRGNSSPSNNFQLSSTLESNVSGDRYSTAIVDAYLKRTGSDGDFVITASKWDGSTGGYSGSIASGSLLTFSESPIRAFSDIPFVDDASASTGSTRGQIGDMYYVEYSMSNFSGGVLGGVNQLNQNIAFQSDNNYPWMQITASGEGGGTSTFDATGSVILRRGNSLTNTTTVGVQEVSMPFLLDNLSAGTKQVTVSGSYDGFFNSNDINRFSIALNKVGLGSGMLVSEFTASFSPSQSMWSPLTTPFVPAYNNYRDSTNSDFIVPTYYGDVLPFNLALDCQPMLNNFILQRQSEFIMDVDYTNESGPIIPVNQEQILEGIAVRAAVPDSNYTALSSINPRYNGVKSTSAKLNVWSIGDFGTYGKTPTVELRDAYFGYFNDLDDPYPNINGLTRVNLSYLVDEQGNALPPSLEPITIDTFNAVFPNTTVGKLAVRDINSKYQDLGSPSSISRTMEYVTPICYSQNSGENYTNSIPLSGSGYISRYDNDDDTDIDFGKFTAVGPASISTGAQLQSVDYVLDPQNTTSTAPSNLPYTASSGITHYPSPEWGTAGQDLNNEQIVSIQTSVVTTYVSETRIVTDELKLHFQMLYSADGLTSFASTSFNLEYIDCKVYTETGQVYLIQNVDSYGWFTIKNLANQQNTGPRYNSSLDRWTTSRVLVPSDGIICTVAWEMYDTLFDLGLMRERSPRNGSGVVALEWIFSANSGKKSIKADGGIKWNMSGSFRNARGGYQQGYFFPATYTGEYTPTKIQGAGVFDHLMSEANQAAAPYWVTGTADNDSNFAATDHTILIMTSSNFNEAYGTGYYQGDVPYLPGTSQYFPGNVEPATTAFDPIENPLEIIEGDEIRFANNENFTYRVLDVFAPQENIGSDSKGYLKLKLDRAVDTSINKDFFLVRRRVVNPNSLYLDTPFPYGILSSGSISQVIMNTGSNGSSGFGLSGSIDGTGEYTGSVSNLELASTPGILFPDFPTEYLIQSASSIVNDLISKGIIDS